MRATYRIRVEHYRFCFPRTDEKLMARLPHRVTRETRISSSLSASSFDLLPGTIVFSVLSACLPCFRSDTRQIASDNLSWNSARTKRFTPRYPRQIKLFGNFPFLVRTKRVEEIRRRANRKFSSASRPPISLSRKRRETSQESGDSRQKFI